MHSSLKALLAAGALIASAGAAAAAIGTAVSALNVRAGPGPGYQVIDTMPPGETVNIVDDCLNGWCEIGMGAMGTGYVSESYLDINGGGGYGRRVIVEESAPVGVSIGGYYGGSPYYFDDGFYFYSGRWYGQRPGRPGWERSWNRDHHWRGPREARGGGYDGPRRPDRGWDGPRRPDRDNDGPRRPDRDDRQRANLDADRPGRNPERVRPMDRTERPERTERGGDQANAGNSPSRTQRMDGGGGGGDRGPRDGGGRGQSFGGGGGGGGGDRGDKIGLDKAR